ncbi:MAG: DUF3822 family protein [Sphingobacteriaceae bacterium]|nr:MAG: DUF3822 family protein [Sphingobacteriaceae bacterium]
MHFVPINFSDPGFNPDYTADFQLVIILNDESFDYAVCHPVTNRLMRINTDRPLKELFDAQNQEKFSASKYQKVVIAAESKSFCLIPDAVFIEENLPDYAAFLSIKEADLILTDQISNGNNTVIFTLPEILVKQLETTFPSVKIQFAPKSWIKTVFDHTSAEKNLYLFIEEKTLKILFPDQKDIRFYNQFDCTSTDEIIYFTALVANQLNLKPEETSLIICGRLEIDSEPMLRLPDFFKEVSLFSASEIKQHSLLKQHQIVPFSGLS